MVDSLKGEEPMIHAKDKRIRRKSLGYRAGRILYENWQLYVMLLPAFLIVLLFKYLPMYGIQIAFRSYRIGQSFTEGSFVGLRYFERFFNNMWCGAVIRNTFVLSAVVRVIEWPFPIVMGLLLFNSSSVRIKKFAQTSTYLPHLISVVVVVSLMQILLNRESGLVNILIRASGGKAVDFFGRADLFFPMYVISELWQGVGFGAIIYLAALSGIDAEISEAALIDGASKLQKIWYIDIPCIMPTIITMLILRCGRMFQLGPDKILLMQTPLNLSVSEIISTYVYKTGVVEMQYGFSTAVGLLNNVVNFTIMATVNAISRRKTGNSIY